jgi:diguanylate cyclase (GGDEF)-like protein
MEQGPGIQRELSRTGSRLWFKDRALESRYLESQAALNGLHNRVAVVLLVALFDLYLIPEQRSAPEIVAFAAFLRLQLLTPITLIFLWLDWRGHLGRLSRPWTMALLIAPTLSASIEALWTSSPTALSFFQAAPLMQLVVLICRLSLHQIMFVNVTSCALFTMTALTARFVPEAVAPSLIMTDIAIGVGTLVFAWRLDLRDRQIFLFNLQAQLGRDLLAGQNRSLARLTELDALTGLGNRRCLDRTIDSLWLADRDRPVLVSLIMFDIDSFKQYNDCLGHQAGDDCIVEVARTVSSCLRDEIDTVARYGGDEFAIILPNTSLDDACQVAERVRCAVYERGLPHPGQVKLRQVTISLGVATVQAPTQTARMLIEAADRCLYEAKRLGRNRAVALPTERLLQDATW